MLRGIGINSLEKDTKRHRPSCSLFLFVSHKKTFGEAVLRPSHAAQGTTIARFARPHLVTPLCCCTLYAV